MPSFNKEVSIETWEDVDIDIDVDEFFDEMSEKDCKEMARLLRIAGYKTIDVESRALDGQDFQEALRKLAANYYSLSNEDIAPIMAVAKRF